MSEEDYPHLWTRRVLANYRYVADKLCQLSQVVQHFTEANILTDQEARSILRGGGGHSHVQPVCNERFLDVLLQKGEAACRFFQEVLQRTTNPHIAASLESTGPEELDHLGAYGPIPPSDSQSVYNMEYVNKVVFVNQVVPGQTPHPKDRQTGQEMSPDDLMISLITQVLASSPGRKRPLHALEQDLCERLRDVTRNQCPNFLGFAGMSFRDFLHKNPSFFNVSTEGNGIVVKIRKDKKNKDKNKTAERSNGSAVGCSGVKDRGGKARTTKCCETADVRVNRESDSQGWKTIECRHRKGTPTSTPEVSEGVSETGQTPIHPSHARSLERQKLTPEQSRIDIERSIDESLIRDLLTEASADTVIFKRSVREYAQDRIQFTLDVVSLWNTPQRDKAYIILGVEPNQKTLIGLHSPTDETFFINLFQGQLFQQLPPRFSYREVVYERKRLGIIQVEVSFGHGFPCIVTSDDMAPKVQKNQLWVRRKGTSCSMEGSDLFVGNIHAWFQAKPNPDSVSNKRVPLTMVGKPDVPVGDSILTPTALLKETEVNRSTCSPPERSSNVKVHSLMKALNHFKKGHFVLVCGSLATKCRNIGSLANAPWIAVYDFDQCGRDSGLLAILEDNLKRKRSVSITTWCDPCTGLTELGTQWWSLRGRREVPHSLTSNTSHQEWSSKVLDKVEKMCVELARYNEDYTVLTFLLLWPSSEIEAKCMHKFLTKVQERIHPKLILCFADPDFDVGQSKVAEMIQYEFENMAKIYQISLEEFCSEIELLQDHRMPDEFQYTLPAEDKTKVVLTDKDAAWLAEDLEVLYMENPYAKRELTAKDLKEEAEHFCRGGTIRWYTWYEVGPGYLDVKRSIADELFKHVMQSFIAKYKSGYVTVFHAPGSGGSTMAQRLIWDVHMEAPCAKVRQRSGSSPEDIADKLVFLHQRSRMPVIALFDGEDEPRLKQILAFLQRSPVVVLQLKRYLCHLSESRVSVSGTETKAYLSGFVTDKESRNLVLRYGGRCDTDTSKVERLHKLDKEVQKQTEKHQMFEYGMTVYAHEFRGVRAYVRGYLDLPLNQNKELEPWQRCLGYIALVYFYGQTAIPCQFFVHIMGKPVNYAMDLNDFPYQFQILVVQDSNEGRKGYLRIAHYIIAREILEQILNRRSIIKECQQTSDASHAEAKSNELSKEAKQCLKDFCIEFIGHVAQKKKKSTVTSPTITYILTKTFIFRDNEEVGDAGIQDPCVMRKKPQFSQIMNDIDSNAPYDGRLEILKSLCNTFPDDPNLRAHLGRFFSLCRPREEEVAESHFKAALRLCFSHGKCKGPDDLDERSKLTLMHIYHMFGNAYQRRIAKYTGWSPGDEPNIHTSQADVWERLTEVIYNATTACEHFLQARLHTQQGQEDCFTYMNEIHVRLQACDFVNRVYPGGLQAFLSRKTTDQKVMFVRDSVIIIEDLIMECYNIILLDRGHLLHKNLRWYTTLFNKCIAQLDNFVTGEDLVSLRLSISRKKLKFRGLDNVVAVENPDVPAEEIGNIVNELESIFKHQNSSLDISKRMLDLHYKDWILAIRNPNFTKVYTVEQVLSYVRQWHESVRSPQSTFYLFVLLTLLGFGTRDRPGSTDYLVEAEMLQEDAMHKVSKTVVRPRFPREWLGQDSAQGILRLVTSSSVGHVEDRCLKSQTFRANALSQLQSEGGDDLG
ncbi:uncharacterized protein LOC143291170 isoform X2 [Babylonia areolata]|uniref:uncharacterized protein LOC143291170 isoform X2 n=1 Tax=Babylonia areolata TaxID=304850 RepID=UPI003FD52372